MTSFEMTDMNQEKSAHDAPETSSSLPFISATSDNQPSAVQVWAFMVAFLMFILTLPLLFFPRFLAFLSDTEATLTPLERFLSNQIGVLLLALSAGCIMATPDDSATSNVRANPLLTPMTITGGLSALLAWNAKGVGSLGTLVCIGNGTIAAWGFWTILFAGSSSISKKTGADKRTSTYLFGNKTAARAQKKEWKERQKNF